MMEGLGAVVLEVVGAQVRGDRVEAVRIAGGLDLVSARAAVVALAATLAGALTVDGRTATTSAMLASGAAFARAGQPGRLM